MNPKVAYHRYIHQGRGMSWVECFADVSKTRVYMNTLSPCYSYFLYRTTSTMRHICCIFGALAKMFTPRGSRVSTQVAGENVSQNASGINVHRVAKAFYCASITLRLTTAFVSKWPWLAPRDEQRGFDPSMHAGPSLVETRNKGSVPIFFWNTRN